MTMTGARYRELCKGAELTDSEIAEGYVFCCEWDGLPVGSDDPEMEFCTCKKAQSEKEESEKG